jgi:hypothetical protein
MKIDPSESGVTISREGRKLRMPLIYFHKLGRRWLDSGYMPEKPDSMCTLDWTDLNEKTQGHYFPILFGKPGFYQRTEHSWILETDIFGGCFFCLSRCEEVLNSTRDAHGRFSAYNSHAYKFNYLEIPLADYYAELLLSAMRRVWPEIQLDRKVYKPQISHDVDSPSLYAFRSFQQVIRSSIADLFFRRDLRSLKLGLRARFHKGTHIDSEDPHNTFEWIIDQVEAVGLKSTFYFLAGQYDPEFDGDYIIEDPLILKLVDSLLKRGHQIGLHPSYTTGLNKERMKIEHERLKEVLGKLGMKEYMFGARMHFLRWFVNETWEMFDSLNIAHDASLGYADHIGFRASTCHPFKAYSVSKRRVFDVEVRPLIVMEASVIDPVYMNMGTCEKAFERVEALRRQCRAVSGIFTLLWHNSRLVLPSERTFFSNLLYSI